jgi:lysophospholipase L1-like esterase
MSETLSTEPSPKTPLSDEEKERRRAIKRKRREEKQRRLEQERKRRTLLLLGGAALALLVVVVIVVRRQHNLRDYVSMATRQSGPTLMVLRNGDMSAEGVLQKMPRGWDHFTARQGKALAYRDTKTFRSAPASLCVAAEGTEGTVANAYQAIRSDGGVTIMVRGAIKVEGDGNAAVAVRLYRSPTEAAAVVLTELKGESDWQTFSKEIPLPKGIVGFDIALGLDGKGKAWLDDVTLTGANTSDRIPTASDPSLPVTLGSAWEKQVSALRETAHAAKDARVIFVGDSLTHLWMDKDNVGLWNERYGAYKAVALGVPGDSTNQLLWRIEHGELEGLSPKVVVLMIGINNVWQPTMERAWIADAIGQTVREVRKRLPKSKVLVLGILPTQHDANFPLRARIKAINEMVARIDDGKNVRFLDMGEKFLEPDGTLSADVMPDYVHLSKKGYEIWADTMQPLLDEMLSE